MNIKIGDHIHVEIPTQHPESLWRSPGSPPSKHQFHGIVTKIDGGIIHLDCPDGGAFTCREKQVVRVNGKNL